MIRSSKIKNGLNGSVLIPGDKSISHRSIIIPSISQGISEINNLLKSEDVLNTLGAFRKMGVRIEEQNNKIIIHGKGLNSLKKPETPIYLGNSGTSARLLIGLLSSQKFESILTGDSSLSSRPMDRIIEPLKKMGALINSKKGMMPISINKSNLKNTSHNIVIPSAQIKSGIILAALNTKGVTKITENSITRDHTEIMLKSFEADINIEKNGSLKNIYINGGKDLTSKNITVPSDLSSSAFFIIAALINKDSKLILNNININPTRDGIIRALKKMNAKIEIFNSRFANDEIVADIKVESSDLVGCELDEEIADLMIDEYPILAIAASFAKSPSVFKGLKELRVKESDRLELIRLNLINCGVNCSVNNDELLINPSKNYKVINNKIRTDYDHRIAMSFIVMGTLLNEDLEIENSDCIKTSFPNFIEIFNKIGGNIIE